MGAVLASLWALIGWGGHRGGDPSVASVSTTAEGRWRRGYWVCGGGGQGDTTQRRWVQGRMMPDEELHAVQRETRQQVLVVRHMELKDDPTYNNQCHKCWSALSSCICARIAPITLKHRYFLLLHYKEYKRSSNSGILVARAGSPQVQLFIYGLQEDEERLLQAVEADPHRFCILYPSEDAVSIAEFVQRTGGDLVNVIVLDGTWRQARRMHRFLPSFLPRVKMDMERTSLYTPLRTQATPERISTLEALAFSAVALGEERTSCESLLDTLKIKVDSILEQTHKDVHYATLEGTANQRKKNREAIVP